MYASVNHTHLYVDVDGAQLRLGSVGLSSVPTIVVLHGGPGFDQGYLRPGVGALRDAAQLVFVDLRGQGRSAEVPLGTCTLEQMADDVVALCDHLRLDRPFLLGHSAGGFVALHAALRGQESFGGLILCSTAAALTAEPDPRDPALVDVAGPEAAAVAARIFAGDVTAETTLAFVKLVAPYYAGPTHRDVPGYLFPLSPPATELMQWFFGDGQQAARYDLRDRLGEITLPTLVISGSHDWVCPPSASDALHTGIPNATHVVIETAGHFPFSEEPERFHGAVVGFLQKHAVHERGRASSLSEAGPDLGTRLVAGAGFEPATFGL
jgi:proline iminopeptidase